MAGTFKFLKDLTAGVIKGALGQTQPFSSKDLFNKKPEPKQPSPIEPKASEAVDKTSSFKVPQHKETYDIKNDTRLDDIGSDLKGKDTSGKFYNDIKNDENGFTQINQSFSYLAGELVKTNTNFQKLNTFAQKINTASGTSFKNISAKLNETLVSLDKSFLDVNRKFKGVQSRFDTFDKRLRYIFAKFDAQERMRNSEIQGLEPASPLTSNPISAAPENKNDKETSSLLGAMGISSLLGGAKKFLKGASIGAFLYGLMNDDREAMSGGMAGLKGEEIYKKFKTFKKGASATKVSKSVIKEAITKVAAKSGFKAVTKKIPGLGLLSGAGLAIMRAVSGDYTGASLELGSGALGGLLPGFGSAASVGVDLVLFSRDVYATIYGTFPEEGSKEQMAEIFNEVVEYFKDPSKKDSVEASHKFKPKITKRKPGLFSSFNNWMHGDSGVYGDRKPSTFNMLYDRQKIEEQKAQFLKFGELPPGFEFLMGNKGLLGRASAITANGIMPLNGFGGEGYRGGGYRSGGTGDYGGDRIYSKGKIDESDYIGGTVDPGKASDRGASKRLVNVPASLGPASVRYNNPGAAKPSPDDEKYGIEGYGIIGGGHTIGKFPTVVHGAAANFDLWKRRYVGLTLQEAINKWRGRNGSLNVPSGFDPNMKLTADQLNDKDFMIKLFKGMAKHEAGRKISITDNQWNQAYDMFRAGGVNEYNKKNPDFSPVPLERKVPTKSLEDMAISRGLLPYGEIKGDAYYQRMKLKIGDDILDMGSGGKKKSNPATPEGLYPLGPVRKSPNWNKDVIPFGRSGSKIYREEDFQNYQIIDPVTGKIRVHMEFHHSMDEKLSTSGCIAVSRRDYEKKFIPYYKQLREKYGQLYLFKSGGQIKIITQDKFDEAFEALKRGESLPNEVSEAVTAVSTGSVSTNPSNSEDLKTINSSILKKVTEGGNLLEKIKNLRIKGADLSELKSLSDLQKVGGQAFKGGKTHEGTLALATMLQDKFGDRLQQFSGFNDKFHSGSHSHHAYGRGFDASLAGGAKDAKQAIQFIKEKMIEAGIDPMNMELKDEYSKKSRRWSGPHFHAAFRNDASAEKFLKWYNKEFGVSKVSDAKPKEEGPEMIPSILKSDEARVKKIIEENTKAEQKKLRERAILGVDENTEVRREKRNTVNEKGGISGGKEFISAEKSEDGAIKRVEKEAPPPPPETPKERPKQIVGPNGGFTTTETKEKEEDVKTGDKPPGIDTKETGGNPPDYGGQYHPESQVAEPGCGGYGSYGRCFV